MESPQNPLERWLDAQKELPGFEGALRRLLGFACVEWFRRSTGAVVSPEEALSRVVALNLPDYPVASWLDLPTRFTSQIADFCEKTKVLPLPEPLKGPIPEVLDLRGVKCPLNAARSRIVMSGYPAGRTLKILLDEGSPIENVPGSLVADGHKVLSREKKGDFWEISVVKSDSRV